MSVSQTLPSLKSLPYWASKDLVSSGIDENLGAIACEYLEDDDAIERFYASADTAKITRRTRIDAQWREIRKKSQARAVSKGALFFQGIDPLTDEQLAWIRCKPFSPRTCRGKKIKYEAPSGVPTQPTFFPVSIKILEKVADRHGVALPADITTTSDGIAQGFWQWVLSHPEIPITLTEGEKKALCLLSQGVVAVSLPGIWNGSKKNEQNIHELSPHLIPFTGSGRLVFICFDMDEKATTQLNVGHAREVLGKLLVETGCEVRSPSWDGSQGKGIDDYIVNGGDWEKAFNTAKPLQGLAYHFAKQAVINRLGKYGKSPDLVVDERCLSAIAKDAIPSTGIVVIVGNTGTGKTKLLNSILTGIDEAIAPGFRISLQRGLSERIGLTYINDAADMAVGRYIDANGCPTYRLSCCWDSIRKIPYNDLSPQAFDLVLDEADQGFKHLISGSTCGKDNKRSKLLEIAEWLIKNAKRVILASATLSEFDIDLVARIRDEKPFILKNNHTANSYPVTIYSGQRGVKGSSTNANATVLTGLIEALKAGETVIVSTDTLSTCNALEVLGKSLGLTEDEILPFNSQNASDVRQKNFADRPNKFLSENNIKLFIHTPSLTSGVSIEVQVFDKVFGFFTGQTINPDDVLQALARYRFPVQRVVYASHWGRTHSFIGAFKSGDFLKALTRKRALIGKAINQALPIDPGNDFELYQAQSQAAENSAMFHFGVSIQARLEVAGCAVKVGQSLPENDTIAAKELFKSAEKAVRDKHYQDVLNAAIIDKSEYTSLTSKLSLSHAEALRCMRFEICEWYKIEPDTLTFEAVKADKKGKYRQQLSRLESLLWERMALNSDIRKIHTDEYQLTQDLPTKELHRQTLESMGIIEGIKNALKGEWTKDSDWLIQFVRKLRHYAHDLKLSIGFTVSKSVDDCRVFGELLKHIGLSSESRQYRENGERLRAYSLSEASINAASVILGKRAETHDNYYELSQNHLTDLLIPEAPKDEPENLPKPSHKSQWPDEWPDEPSKPLIPAPTPQFKVGDRVLWAYPDGKEPFKVMIVDVLEDSYSVELLDIPLKELVPAEQIAGYITS